MPDLHLFALAEEQRKKKSRAAISRRDTDTGMTSSRGIADLDSMQDSLGNHTVTSLVAPGRSDLKKNDPGVSFELQDARRPERGELEKLGFATESEARVFLWLQEHASEIMAAETRFRVDRRAIAGAIAWEALENVRSNLTSAAGNWPGQGPLLDVE